MPSAEYDLEFLRASLASLEDYLFSKELYWPLGARPPAGEPQFPPLTLGSLLLAQARLHACPLTFEQRDLLARLDEQIDEIRSRWRAAWGRKAAHDFRARLKLWRDFLEEHRQNPEGNYDRYAYEARRRAMLHLLAEEADDLAPEEIELLSALDSSLKAALEPAPFLWGDELAPGFPGDTYWYLYGNLGRQG